MAGSRQRKGWTKYGGAMGVGGVWKHESGWIVKHCGHPTALWPYYAVSPKGTMLIHVKRAFGKLVYAQEAVEGRLRGEQTGTWHGVYNEGDAANEQGVQVPSGGQAEAAIGPGVPEGQVADDRGG
jgi:hypothetical protein